MCGASPTEYRQEFLRDDATCALGTRSNDTVAFHGTASADRGLTLRQLRASLLLRRPWPSDRDPRLLIASPREATHEGDRC